MPTLHHFDLFFENVFNFQTRLTNTYLGKISSNVGIRVDPQKETEIIQAIKNLALKEAKRIEFGKNARKKSFLFDKEKILDAFLQKINLVFH